MKRTRLIIISVFFALFIAIMFFGGRYLFVTIGWDGLTTHVERQSWRDRICYIVEDLQLGMSKDQVEQVADKHDWRYSYVVGSKQSEVQLRTPIELWAQNWIVYLTFKNQRMLHLTWCIHQILAMMAEYDLC